VTVADIPAAHRELRKAYEAVRAPVIDLVAAQTRDPFRVLVGTILSARTKDQTTAGACERLFARVRTPEELRRLSVAEIERLIFPVGFYHTKAQHLKALPDALDARFGGRVPAAVEALCELPGVGRKTANLVVVLGFGQPGVCVDVHVHRICNRLGLVRTGTPLETEMTLRRILPRRYWMTWNSCLVAFGQTRCLPRRPRCEDCPLRRRCDTGRARRLPAGRYGSGSSRQVAGRALADTVPPATATTS
jgi:endonuclease III